ncbi:sugar phosphate isomerase/epimerase family protein [Pontibacter silvestris]|uniref:Sugar phosphate isomerase/epimerase family protein n=1 Tax=Pontibacter silvestris TaxID=2305183 RepID=A0ABW4X2H7_9BACT|nr:sugar phosphate isomerase/epimerase family protein [Pontibacter silvestris]MCC9134809.1 sugar phosphate isomerase/epimerase [Pontibacter silvestris]
MMPKFGASILSWIPKWTPEGGLYAIQKTASSGFDIVEISLPASMDFDAKTVKKQLAKHGIEGRCSLILPKDCHLPHYPKQATQLLKKALDKVEAMGGNFLGGVLYAAIGSFTGAPCTDAEKNMLQDVLSEVADYARLRDITLALEPVNRYESYVLTSAAEVLQLTDRMHVDNIGLMLDTFHMNVEESNFFGPVVQAGDKLKYLHITESDRGMLGEGNVRWDDLFKALAAINYAGPLVLENFSSHLKELVGPTSLWRKSKYDPEALAKGSLAFMKKKAKQWNIGASATLEI